MYSVSSTSRSHGIFEPCPILGKQVNDVPHSHQKVIHFAPLPEKMEQYPCPRPPSSMQLHNQPTLKGRSSWTMCSVSGSSQYRLSAEITLFICPKTILCCSVCSGANYLHLSHRLVAVLECCKNCKRCPTTYFSSPLWKLWKLCCCDCHAHDGFLCFWTWRLTCWFSLQLM